MKRFFLMIFLLFLLLIFHEAAITGTRNGLLLWYQTLIPSLMPFLLITNALSETGAYEALSAKISPKSPKIYQYLVILLGNLCGYPIGGKMISDFIRHQYLSPDQGNRLLAVASQASPMFLIGYVYQHTLKDILPLSVFLSSIYIPVLLFYAFLSMKHTDISQMTTYTSSSGKKICDTFLHAVQIMVMIGLYVMIFSILLTILLPVCSFPEAKLILSTFEITNGIHLLSTLSLSYNRKAALICALSAFGGLCSAFQILSVLNYPHASIKKYLLDKCILSAGTFLFIECYYRIF